MGRTLVHPSIQDITIDGILYALSDPERRLILKKLIDSKGINCSEACKSKLSPSTMSFHFKILRENGLIFSEKKGVEVINTSRKSDVDKRFPGLLNNILKYS